MAIYVPSSMTPAYKEELLTCSSAEMSLTGLLLEGVPW